MTMDMLDNKFEVIAILHKVGPLIREKFFGGKRLKLERFHSKRDPPFPNFSHHSCPSQSEKFNIITAIRASEATRSNISQSNTKRDYKSRR